MMNNSILYALTVIIWGTTWIAIELQLGVVPPEVSVFYRYAMAAAILFSWCAARGLPLRYSLPTHVRFAGLGLFMFSLNYIAAYHGQRFIASALMAIAFSTLVWMNIINLRLFFGTRTERKVLIGAALGVIGICFMFWPSIADFSFSDATVLGALLGLGGTYLASIGNMISQAAQNNKIPIVQANAWGMGYGAIVTGLIAKAQGMEFVFDYSLRYVSSLFYLAVFGSVIAFGAYLTLLGRIGAQRAGYITILFPIVAIFLSVLYEGLHISALMVVGVVLVLLGNVLVLRRNAPAKNKIRSSGNVGVCASRQTLR